MCEYIEQHACVGMQSGVCVCIQSGVRRFDVA